MGLVAAFAVAGCGDEPLPPAADGADLRACSDGRCEVRVRSGDAFDIEGFGRVEVTVDGDRLEVASRSDDGRGNSSSLSAGGVAGRRLQLNDQVFTIVAIREQQAVLRVGA